MSNKTNLTIKLVVSLILVLPMTTAGQANRTYGRRQSSRSLTSMENSSRFLRSVIYYPKSRKEGVK